MGEEWVDVTPDTNTFSLNLTDYIVSCEAQEFPFAAKVFHVKIRALDLCNKPITYTTYPRAYFEVYRDGKLIGFAGLGADGTMDIPWVPGGTFNFRLFWKGFTLPAINITTGQEISLVVDKNIGTAVDLTFPIGNLNVTLTMWDINNPIYNLSVKLQYLKDGKVVFTRRHRSSPTATVKSTFTQVPLLPLTTDEGSRDDHTTSTESSRYTYYGRTTRSRRRT